MKEPLVSIVVPTFNAERFLKSLIEAILSQTYISWELLIIDDNSTDNTQNMVVEYLNKDARIAYQIRDRIPKGGQTCRNIGLQNAKGKYIVFFDADDMVSDFCLKQRVDFMEQNSDLQFAVFPATSFVNVPGDSNSIFYGFDLSHDVLSLFIARILPFVVWTNIYRLDALKSQDLHWDENLKAAQDSDFNLGAIFKGLSFRYFPEHKIDYFWRINPLGITNSIKGGQKNESQIYFFNKLISRLTKENYLPKYKRELLVHFFEILKIFISSRDYQAIDSVMKPLNAIVNNVDYAKLRLVAMLYKKVPAKVPYEYIFFHGVYSLKMRLLAHRQRVKENQIKEEKI